MLRIILTTLLLLTLLLIVGLFNDSSQISSSLTSQVSQNVSQQDLENKNESPKITSANPILANIQKGFQKTFTSSPPELNNSAGEANQPTTLADIVTPDIPLNECVELLGSQEKCDAIEARVAQLKALYPNIIGEQCGKTGDTFLRVYGPTIDNVKGCSNDCANEKCDPGDVRNGNIGNTEELIFHGSCDDWYCPDEKSLEDCRLQFCTNGHMEGEDEEVCTEWQWDPSTGDWECTDTDCELNWIAPVCDDWSCEKVSHELVGGNATNWDAYGNPIDWEKDVAYIWDSITEKCAAGIPLSCTTDSECDDSNSCTQDICNPDGVCENSSVPGTYLTCQNNACVAVANTPYTCTNQGDCAGKNAGESCGIPVSCIIDADCNDQNACTLNKCVDSICEYPAIPGTYLTCVGTSCSAVPSTPFTCTDREGCIGKTEGGQCTILFMCPVPSYPQFSVTQEFDDHSGIDLAVCGDPSGTEGKPASAITDGIIEYYDSSDCGTGIKLISGSYTFKYCHLSERSVPDGQLVSAGTQIGLIGDTGTSTGPHLHLEVYRNGILINPRELNIPCINFAPTCYQ